MTLPRFGRALIVIASVFTIIIPIGVDGFIFARAHMNNPLWLPHAKLHCAMSFFGAISLGLAALLHIYTKPVSDRSSMGIAAFLSTAFWIGLISSGAWPGTSYGFENDPAVYIAPPVVLGVPIEVNAAIAIFTVFLGTIGYILISVGNHTISNSASKTH